MTTRTSLVSIVDDSASIRESLPDLLTLLGYEARAFATAEEFLASGYVDRTSCLLLDVNLPGMTGPDLQRELTRRQCGIPIVFITSYLDKTTRLRLLELGAVACLSKPFDESALVAALDSAARTP